jgi:hypothetical protein
MFVNDFDLNGTVEQIISVYDGDKSYPLALKHDLTKQLPGLLNKYPKYEMYKGQQVADIFPPEQLKRSVHLNAYVLETSLFFNDGTGHFTRKPLPVEAQLSTTMSAGVNDFDNDGFNDILLGGNLFNVKPEVGRYDASYGTFLKGNGRGDFKNIPAKKSGFRLNGEIRDMVEISTSKDKILVIARNNDSLQVLNILKR